jgi:DNA ligase-1
MNRFAALLDRLAYEPGRNAKLRLIAEYLRSTTDPDRGWALAALTVALSFAHAKPGIVRALIAQRVDPVSRCLMIPWAIVALMWPRPGSASLPPRTPSVSEGVTTLAVLGKLDLPAQLAQWLDGLDETGRWAMLKLVTGALRIGVSARLAKTAVAVLGNKDPNEVELIWSQAPLYPGLFAWLEGRADKPITSDLAPFRPVMLAHALEEGELGRLDPAAFIAEWKSACKLQQGRARIANVLLGSIRVAARTSRPAFRISRRRSPSTVRSMELLIMRERHVQSFNTLQERLNRKTVTTKMLSEFPAHLRAYDFLFDNECDVRDCPFVERRASKR